MEINAKAAKERQREREERRRAAAAAGVEVKEEEETDEEAEDYMGVGPLIAKLERQRGNYNDRSDQFWEPTDSESDEDDERYYFVTRLGLFGSRVVFLFAV